MGPLGFTGWLTRWENKWVHVYSFDCPRDDAGTLHPFRGRLLAVGPDYLVVRQHDGVEVIFQSASIHSVSLVTDQTAVDLEAMAAAGEKLAAQDHPSPTRRTL